MGCSIHRACRLIELDTSAYHYRSRRAGENRRERRDLLRLHVIREFCFLQMDVQNLNASSLVRPVHQHLAIEAARAKKRRIENLRPVGGGQQHKTSRRIETVELDEQLVQRLLLLVVAAGKRTDAARAPERIELVDEDDGRRLRARLLEQ